MRDRLLRFLHCVSIRNSRIGPIQINQRHILGPVRRPTRRWAGSRSKDQLEGQPKGGSGDLPDDWPGSRSKGQPEDRSGDLSQVNPIQPNARSSQEQGTRTGRSRKGLLSLMRRRLQEPTWGRFRCGTYLDSSR